MEYNVAVRVLVESAVAEILLDKSSEGETLDSEMGSQLKLLSEPPVELGTDRNWGICNTSVASSWCAKLKAAGGVVFQTSTQTALAAVSVMQNAKLTRVKV